MGRFYFYFHFYLFLLCVCVCVCAVMAVLLKERITNGGMRTAGRNRGAASSLLKAQSRPSRQREAAEGRDGSAGLWRRGCGGVAGVTDPLREGGERRSGQPYGAPRGGTRAAGRAAAGRRAAPVRLLGGAAAAPPPPAAAIQRAAAAVPSGKRSPAFRLSPVLGEAFVSDPSGFAAGLLDLCFFPSFAQTVPP